MNRRYLSYILAALLSAAALFLAACGSDTKATTMKLAGTRGTVEVADAKEESVALIENLPLYSGYQVGTQTDSYAWINLDDTKLTKLDMDSAVHIQKTGTELEMIVDRGSLYFHITKPLEDETLSIRTSTMVVGIRGTMGWVDATDPERMKVFLLEGTVEVSANGEDDAEGAVQTATVTAGQMAEVTLADGTVQITVTTFQEEEIPAFVMEETMKLDAALQEEIFASLESVGEAGTAGTEQGETETVGADQDGTGASGTEPDETETAGTDRDGTGVSGTEPDETEDDVDGDDGEHTRLWIGQNSGSSIPAIHSFDWSDGTLTLEIYHVVADSGNTMQYPVPGDCIWAKNGGYAEDPETGEISTFVEDPVSYEEFKEWFDDRIASFEAEHPGEDIPYGIGISEKDDIVVAVYIYNR